MLALGMPAVAAALRCNARETLMDTTTHHTMQDLFDQLGLPNSTQPIDDFVRQHRPLPNDMRLADAPFWSDSQAAFLREKIREDGDWALLVDSLNVQLHETDTNSTAQPQCPADPADGDGMRTAAQTHP